MATSGIHPTTLTLRAYQVGFGDCFLLTFHYPARGKKKAFDRHVLIDFGTSSPPKNGRKNYMVQVAKDIEQRCGGKLDAVVVTHRHLDHLSGFAPQKDGKGSGDIIRALKPSVIVQPWTEDPRAARDALGPTDVKQLTSLYLQSIVNMEAFANVAVEQTIRLQGKLGKRRLQQLAFLGEENIKNPDAVKNLMSMGKNSYVYYGSRSGLEKVLPGVKIHVLGPPTLRQSSAIRKKRTKDEVEFWQLQAAAGKQFAPAAGPLFPSHTVHPKGRPISSVARWLIPRMLNVHANQLFEIVRTLDEAMNNTSVILLFETEHQKLLFPGDAQIENWSYSLQDAPNAAAIKPLLEEVDIYKVGHHGSGNATPRSLWALFKNKGGKTKAGRLKTLLSTKPGKHHNVPQEDLVAALNKETDCIDTEKFKSSELNYQIGPIPL